MTFTGAKWVRTVFALALLLASAWNAVASTSAGALNSACNTSLSPQIGAADPAQLEAIAEAIHTHRAEFRRILLAMDNEAGADYEIEQTLAVLRGVRVNELTNLRNTRPLNKVAVYGSSNIPLYTLALHALIPSTVAQEVVFRTPQVSRQVYIELFALLRQVAPNPLTARIRLLTEDQEVRYGNFLDHHILGPHPADSVIFAGNPSTGRKIVEKIKGALAARSEYHHMAFLLLGAGVNPFVVTEDTTGRMQPAWRAALENITINNGQDCLSSSVYFVHESVKDEFLNGLKERTQDMAPAPLTYANKEHLAALQSFTASHRGALINGDRATFDAATGMVTPHIYSLPYEEFAAYELQEFFAPFAVVFTYKSEEDLERIAADPRIRQRAFVAPVFGYDPNAATQRAMAIFGNSGHQTLLNSSAFSEENGNLPFGGYGPDASAVFVLSNTGVTEESRPVLFSAEMRRYFSSGLLWKAPEAPLDPRARGIEDLRALARSRGITIAYYGKAPRTPEERARLERFYGAPLLFTTDRAFGAPVLYRPGLMLHPSDPAVSGDYFRGEANPHLGYADLHDELGAKWPEYQLAERVWPGLMAPTILYSHINPTPFALGDRAHLREVVRGALDAAKARFPMGAFIKSAGALDAATGDKGTMITTDSNSDALVDRFLSAYQSVALRMEPGAAVTELLSDEHPWTRFVASLLAAPERILVQQRLPLARTKSGALREYRVDFIDGEPILVHMRYGTEFYPADMDRAQHVIREFFQRAPRRYRYLSGGADVAFDESGNPYVIEFNFGAACGSIMPEIFPIYANDYVSILQDRLTPLMAELEVFYHSDLEDQRRYLMMPRPEFDLWEKASLDDVSLSEIVQWYRDRVLTEWSLLPATTRTAPDAVMARLRALLTGIGRPDNNDLPRLLREAEEYLTEASAGLR